MAENRRGGGEHRPMQRTAAFAARLPFTDGAGGAGRWLAKESLTEAAKIVSGHVLGDGSKGRARKNSKKKIFYGVSAFGG